MQKWLLKYMYDAFQFVAIILNVWHTACHLLMFYYCYVTGPEEGQCTGCTLLPGYNIGVCDKDEDGITRKFAFKVCQL